MADGTQKRGRGRPRKELDVALAKRLAMIQCPPEEIAAVLDVSRATVYRRLQDDPEFREALEEGYLQGKASLRRLQFQQARTSPAMAIFLGKNLLGQRDFKPADVFAMMQAVGLGGHATKTDEEAGGKPTAELSLGELATLYHEAIGSGSSVKH